VAGQRAAVAVAVEAKRSPYRVFSAGEIEAPLFTPLLLAKCWTS